MPPPTLSAAVFVLVLVPVLLFAAVESYNPCSTPATVTKCSPFSSTLPFPFSVYPGCGHPSFRIRCSVNSTAAIVINNISFSVIQYDPNATSLTISLASSRGVSESDECSSTSVSSLGKPISFSGSPFRVSDSSCSRLSVLLPCETPDLPNCTSCPWECKLIENPIHLISDCSGFSTRRHEAFQPECPNDVLGVLDRMLKIGLEVEWDVNQDPFFSSCETCRNSNGLCGYNSSDPKKAFLCYLPLVRIHRQGPNTAAIYTITFLIVCILIALFLGFAIFRFKAKYTLDEDPTITLLRRHRSSCQLPPVFTFEELDSSTDHFDSKRKLGDGGFGSVYLGRLQDNRLVAVKYLHKHTSGTESAKKGNSKKSFCNEILILSSINHPNLVKLHGYCCDPRGLLLAYDFVPNGTLADHIHGGSVGKRGILPWITRVDMAFQTAVAIEYLHFSVTPPIVHRDITSSNIFVEKDMRVKLGDFGLSRLLVLPESESELEYLSGSSIWTGPQGTPGYLDPDYCQSFMLNEKSDIYSFGVVLLELVTGMKAVDASREKREVALVDLVVPRIQKGALEEVIDPVLVMDEEVMLGINAVAELAFRCVAADKDDRPDAREVASELKRIRCRCHGGSGVLRGSACTSNAVVPGEAGIPSATAI